ncbi:MAG: acetyltransferase [Ruminococcaceae bacterium]|nr:acetyltransferase [Oscillospiraceae bacterium]
MKQLFIIGAGGFGRELAWLVERINLQSPTWELAGFVDDDPEKIGTRSGDYPIIGGCDVLTHKYGDFWVACAIGSPKVRKQITEHLEKQSNIKFATLIDPSVIMSERVRVGSGSMICAGSVLTVDIKLGKHSIVNLNCTIGHDVEFGDYLTAYPNVNISGKTNGGDCVEIGTGVQIRQGLRIASHTTIGAGAVVVKDIEESGTYVGVPARRMHTGEG